MTNAKKRAKYLLLNRTKKHAGGVIILTPDIH